MLDTQKLCISENNSYQGQISKNICNISGNEFSSTVSVCVTFFCVDSKGYLNFLMLCLKSSVHSHVCEVVYWLFKVISKT